MSTVMTLRNSSVLCVQVCCGGGEYINYTVIAMSLCFRLVVCGDGEYVIYAGITLRKTVFVSGLLSIKMGSKYIIQTALALSNTTICACLQVCCGVRRRGVHHLHGDGAEEQELRLGPGVCLEQRLVHLRHPRGLQHLENLQELQGAEVLQARLWCRR